MAILFNLWNRYFPTGGECEFDASMANAPRIQNGTAEFIAACLKSLDIPNPARSWTVRPFRTNFYTDYPSPREVWQDRWAAAWEVRVELDGETRGLDSRLDEFPEPVEVLDRSWNGSRDEPPFTSDGVLIAVFPGDAQNARHAGEVVVQHARRFATLLGGEIHVHTFRSNRHQLRAWFPGVRFPDWIKTGDEMAQICAGLGGVLNRRDLDMLPQE